MLLPMPEERLQKILSRSGVTSRRKAEQMILEGRITVNGTVITELGSKADLERGRSADAIAVARPDGRNAVTVTPRVLERAERIVFAVAGADKQTAVRMLLERDTTQVAWCAVSGCREVEIWADSDALASG